MSTRNHRVGGFDEPLLSRYRTLNNRAFETATSSQRTAGGIHYGTGSGIMFSKTRTLTGAFEATASPRSTPGANGGEADDEARKYRTGRDGMGSSTSPKFSRRSPRPREVVGSYKVLRDADNTAAVVVEDDQVRRDQGSPSPGPRNHRALDTLGRRAEDEDYGVDMDFLDDVSDDDLRIKLAQHAIDERRLKHATTSRQGPMFSKAKDIDMRTALSMENLQRHQEAEVEDMEQDAILENGENLEPALNSRRTWGARGRRPRDWLDGVVVEADENDNDEKKKQEEDPIRLAIDDWDNDLEFTARSLQVSDSPPVNTAAQEKHGDGARSRFPAAASQPSHTDKNFRHDRIDTNVSSDARSSSFALKASEKPRLASRGNSSQLLRKLTRRASSPVNTPQQQKMAMKTPLTAKTPVVTGAWIDTPITERKTSHVETIKEEEEEEEGLPSATEPKSAVVEASKSLSQIAADRQSQPRRTASRVVALKEPKHPKSALESILEKEKAGDYSLILGENTLDSLNDILEDKPAPAKISTIKGESPTSEPSSSTVHVGTDEETIDRVNSKLKSLLRNINEARAGLSSLEHQAEESIAQPKAKGSKRTSPGVKNHRHSTSPCEACGLYGDGRLYFALPSRRFWKRLGWAFLIFFVWWIAEFFMCDYYCHPFYAEKCERNCLNPNAPRYPYVIPTMLWRWSHLSTVLSPVWSIVVGVFRFVLQLLGLWDGFFDSSPGYYYTPRGRFQPPISTIYQPKPPLYSQGGDSMQGDEYL